MKIQSSFNSTPLLLSSLLLFIIITIIFFYCLFLLLLFHDLLLLVVAPSNTCCASCSSACINCCCCRKACCSGVIALGAPGLLMTVRSLATLSPSSSFKSLVHETKRKWETKRDINRKRKGTKEGGKTFGNRKVTITYTASCHSGYNCLKPLNLLL